MITALRHVPLLWPTMDEISLCALLREHIVKYTNSGHDLLAGDDSRDDDDDDDNSNNSSTCMIMNDNKCGSAGGEGVGPVPLPYVSQNPL